MQRASRKGSVADEAQRAAFKVAMSYDLFEHRSRFAVWAAARAAQRGLTSVKAFKECLGCTDLRGFVADPNSLATEARAFEEHHRRWCSAILGQLRGRGLNRATYGRAAKFVAIYLKAMIIVGPDANSRLASVIHPPIDRVFLKNVTAAYAESARLRRWSSTAWTKLEKRDYYRLIADLRTVLEEHEPFWTLERYWTFAGDI